MEKLAKSAFCVTCCMVLSKVLGLLREILLANRFGTTRIADAYSIAITLPSVIFAVFAGGFSNSYLPVYTRLDSPEKKQSFFCNVTTILTIFSIVFMVITVLGADIIAGILAPGFSGESLELVQMFIRIVAFILPFDTIFNQLSCQGQANEDFIFAEFCNSIIINLIIIGSIQLATVQSPGVLMWGYVMARVVAVGIFAVYLSRKWNVRYSWKFDVKDKNFSALVALAIPLGLSLLANQLNALVDKMFSSSLGEGITSAISYANRIQLLPYSLTVSVVLAVCYPRINKCFASKSKEEGLFYIQKASSIAMLLSVPVAIFILFFSNPLIKLIFERGAFTGQSTIITAECLLFYSIGIPFYALREIASKTLASNLRQRQIFKNTIISVLVNILLDWILVRYLNYRGLALATSIAGIVAFLLMNRDVRRIGLSLFDPVTFRDGAKIILSSIVSVAAAYVLNTRILTSVRFEVSMLCTFLLAGVLYFCLNCFVLKTNVVVWGVKLMLRSRKHD